MSSSTVLTQRPLIGKEMIEVPKWVISRRDFQGEVNCSKNCECCLVWALPGLASSQTLQLKPFNTSWQTLIFTFCSFPLPQYRSGIYYHDDQQKEAILKKVAEINEKLSSGVWGKWVCMILTVISRSRTTNFQKSSLWIPVISLQPAQ
jgi:hypothetical protein